MIARPKRGQLVQVWYRKGVAEWMPHHGKVGRVVVVGRGKPLNHAVDVGGFVAVVPCGNLREPKVEGR